MSHIYGANLIWKAKNSIKLCERLESQGGQEDARLSCTHPYTLPLEVDNADDQSCCLSESVDARRRMLRMGWHLKTTLLKTSPDYPDFTRLPACMIDRGRLDVSRCIVRGGGTTLVHGHLPRVLEEW